MIEVEKKFLLNDQDIARLIEGAEFLGEVVNKDYYYDNVDNRFLTSGSWLRKRNDHFELKISMLKSGQNETGGVECYKELNSEADIANEIGLNLENSLKQNLEKSGYKPFAEIITNRKKYKKGNFHIDIDQTNFNHDVVEIELEVADENHIKSAKERIEEFAIERGLSLEEVHGKMSYYLKKFNPDKYKIMVDARPVSNNVE